MILQPKGKVKPISDHTTYKKGQLKRWMTISGKLVIGF